MTKKPDKPRVVSVEIPPEVASDDDLTPAERAAEYAREAAGMSDDDAEDFFQGIDELRGTQGVTFQVNRTEPLEKAGFCFEYPGGAFTLLRLTKDYGPGTYRIRVKGPGGRYIPGGGTVKIAEGLAVDQPDKEASSVQDMLSLLKADRERQSDNMLKWVAALSPLLAPVIANLFANKSQVTELVAALGSLQGLQPKAKEPPDMMTQLDQLGGVLSKLKEMSGDSNQTGATWIDLVRDALQGAKPMLEGIAARVAGQGVLPSRSPMMVPPPLVLPSTPTAPAVGAGAQAASPTVTEAQAGAASSPLAAPPSDPMLQLLGWLKATAEGLAEQARRDKDPEFYAEVVADNLPDGIAAPQVLEYIAREDWWPMFSNFAPACAPYQGWFTRFRDALVAILRKEIKRSGQNTPKPPPATPDPVPEPESFE